MKNGRRTSYLLSTPAFRLFRVLASQRLLTVTWDWLPHRYNARIIQVASGVKPLEQRDKFSV
jgi:hypothetical protein